MAIWSDVADWIGTTPNRNPGGMVAHRGLVLHIQEGTEQGTEAWQRNPASQISSHFLAPKVGRPRQMVDTADKAWTEAAGNPYWLSVEIEGRAGDALTGDQVAGIAAIYARGVRDYDWPLASTNDVDGTGLGWHGMGGTAWGGHSGCPGAPIIAQRPQILAVAKQILNPAPATEEDSMGASLPPFPIDNAGTTSLTIPPVEGGVADPRQCWLSFCNDTGNATYALRVYVTNGQGSYAPLWGADGVVVCKSGMAVGKQLPAGVRGISISRVPAIKGGTIYSGSLSGVIERGPVLAKPTV